MSWVTFEDTNANITYNGDWYVSTDSGYSASSAHSTFSAAATAAFNFTGTGLQIGSDTYTNKAGNIIATIDGIDYALSEYGSAAYQQIVFSKTGLIDTEHTCILSCPGLRSGLSWLIDFLQVTGTILPYNSLKNSRRRNVL